ncbi:DUF1353 domain-containing protein [Phaeobacter sp. J2-8]|uniref:DUF1353 domain-containing protein n=1 Tax=Phaeobacter sp. J2-8 TaxID=2931394 RepID=UPI001FCFBA9C|nr:DUF1353 domain-containing protein [Phaeobacter sp. J2-8]
MLKYISGAACALLILSGCDTPQTRTGTTPHQTANQTMDGPECGGPGTPECRFFDGPFLLADTSVRLPTREVEFFPLARPLGFVDGGASNWRAEPGTLTDGASIPPIFVNMIGDPRSRQFAQAAAMHDAYCGIGNDALPTYHSRDWRETHRMFYDGLRVGGTAEIRAKVMYAAVYLGGPRWGDTGRDLSAGGVVKHAATLGFAQEGGALVDPRMERALRDNLQPHSGSVPDAEFAFAQSPFGTSFDAYERDLSGVPVSLMRAQLRAAADYIQTTKPTPTLVQIEAFIERREARMLARLVGPQGNDDAGEEPSKSYEPEEEVDEPVLEPVDPEYPDYPVTTEDPTDVSVDIPATPGGQDIGCTAGACE